MAKVMIKIEKNHTPAHDSHIHVLKREKRAPSPIQTLSVNKIEIFDNQIDKSKTIPHTYESMRDTFLILLWVYFQFPLSR